MDFFGIASGLFTIKSILMCLTIYTMNDKNFSKILRKWKGTFIECYATSILLVFFKGKQIVCSCQNRQSCYVWL